MLDKEQGAYIDGLRTSHPGLDDTTLTDTLKAASWSPEEINEALSRYQGKITLPPPPPSVPIIKNIPATVPTQDISTTANSTPAVAPTALVPSPTTVPVSLAVQKPVTENLVATEPHVKRSYARVASIILITLLVLTGISAAGYYVYTKTTLFTPDTLTEENILENIIIKLSEIETTSSEVTFALGVHPREADAQPFSITAPTTPEMLAMYQRDQDRFRDIGKIQSSLSSLNYKKLPYPATLDTLITKTTDPLGVPYIYTKTDDATKYTLVVTFETTEAAQIASNSIDYTFDTESSNEPVNKTVTISGNKYISTYKFTGKPAQPKLFGFYELSEIENFIPLGLQFNFSTEATVDNSTEAPLNARFRVTGDAVFSDANFAFDAEGMKHGDEYYGIINKLPSFFSKMSQIRGTWVKFTEEDLRNYGYGTYIDSYVPSKKNERTELIAEKREQMKVLLELAKKHQLIRFSAEPTKEIKDGETFTRYQLALRQEKLLPFYEEATKALETYGDKSLLPYDAKTVDYLKSPDFTRVYEYLLQNSSFTLWVDSKGFPARYEFRVRYVPSDAARALKEHQLDFVINVNFRDINQPITVTPPDSSVPFDEFLMKLTGMSKEEITLGIQTTNVTSVRNALREYYAWTGDYPNSLSELEKKRKDVPKSNQSASSTRLSYLDSDYYKDIPFLKIVPTDVHTKQEYVYTKNTNYDYELKYQVKFPSYTSTMNPRNYYTTTASKLNDIYDYGLYTSRDVSGTKNQPILVPKFVDGENIATKDALSQAELQTSDSDGDFVSDNVEKILGTNPSVIDTDDDGFTDREEIISGSNPLGPGKLEYINNRSSFDYF